MYNVQSAHSISLSVYTALALSGDAALPCCNFKYIGILLGVLLGILLGILNMSAAHLQAADFRPVSRQGSYSIFRDTDVPVKNDSVPPCC